MIHVNGLYLPFIIASIFIGELTILVTLRLFDIAMENDPFVEDKQDGLPIKNVDVPVPKPSNHHVWVGQSKNIYEVHKRTILINFPWANSMNEPFSMNFTNQHLQNGPFSKNACRSIFPNVTETKTTGLEAWERRSPGGRRAGRGKSQSCGPRVPRRRDRGSSGMTL